MGNPVFVALDTTETAQAIALARRLGGLVGGLKLGLEFFTAQGPSGIAPLAELGLPLFIDLKLHDIPNTVAASVRSLVRLSPALATLHASGGLDMMTAAVDAAGDEAAKRGVAAPKLLAVTVLTSLDQPAATAVGYSGSVQDQVCRLAELAERAGVAGLVCSPLEVAALRARISPATLLVVPGIRPSWSETGDQKRFMTPSQARAEGADLLVIGRPITAAADPAEAARRIASELGLP